LYNNLVTLAVLQSGLSNSPISFTSVIPYEDFEKIYNKTLSKLESIPNLDDFYNIGVFQRNNWSNDDVVPYERARWIQKKDGTMDYNPAMKYLPKQVKSAIESNQIPPIISVSTLGRKSNSDFFVYSWEDASITKEKKAEMRKKGDFSYIKRGLFRKVKDNGQPFVHTSNDKNYYIYQAVNAWGARERAQEFYDVEKPSEIDNGFIKVTNVAADQKIVNLFTGKGVTASTPVANKNKPGDLPAIDRTPPSC
jgi:hypothetical protein